ncbi:unnamed protein product [Adineta ricciae]|nr:unnamed protein product [Adineta ricciae]
MVGLISALLSTFGFSLQNIYSKKSLKDISIHHYALLALLAKISWCMFVPFWFFYDGIDIFYNTKYHSYNSATKILFYLVLDGLLNFLHNVVAFTMISLVSPLSYSIANSTKRIVVICVSLLILRNPVTKTNVIGMSLALFGVMYYNKAKLDQRRAQQKQGIIPLVRSEPALNTLNLGKIQFAHPDSDLISRHHPSFNTSRPYYNGFIPNYASQSYKNV